MGSSPIPGAWRSAAGRLPSGANTEQLALLVLTTMEGAVMLARTYRDIEPYDNAVTLLRDYFERLIADGTDWVRPKRKPRKGKLPAAE